MGTSLDWPILGCGCSLPATSSATLSIAEGAANPSKVGVSARPLLGLPMDRDGTGTAGFESEDPADCIC